MAGTGKRSVAAQAMIDWIGDSQLDLTDVFYGDERLIAKTPAVSVAPGGVSRELVGAQYITRNEIVLEIIVYHGRDGSIGLTRRKCDEFAEAVEDHIHNNRNLGGNVIHGYVRAVEPGYAAVSNVIFMATQLTWEGISKTRLGV